jgi:hypothetical protein
MHDADDETGAAEKNSPVSEGFVGIVDSRNKKRAASNEGSI